METIKFNFAKEYSPYPGGRFIKLGEFSGEDFRENVLVPIFESNKKISIDGSNVKTSFSPSFLDECFGELAKRYGYKKFIDTVELYSTDNPSLHEKMMYYVNRAVKNASR